ncbi:MAG: glycosyltransferase family 39 protein [Acidobacteriales bacterium]|nr:glycosyltransferase family 39 protein [Terriglobales bacterium]
MRLNRDNIRPLLVLGVLCGFLFFYGISNFGLLGADEPRYAQIGREMLERNDWVTPRLHGEVWLEKPVLYYWLEMVAYKLFGVSDWAARLPAALLGTLLIAAIYVFIRRFRPGAEMEAAIITASAVAIFGFARGVSTDMPLAVFFSVALLGWWAFVESGQRRWLLVFYAGLALAALAKGPVAVALAALIIGLFAILARDGRLLLRSLWPPGIALFFALALPWYVLVQQRNPQFFSEFILSHNLARFSTDVFRHTRPFWYFIPVLLLGLLPWTTLSIAGAVRAVREWKSQRERYGLFLLLWAVVPIVFFSLSQSKLPGYILPAIPAWTLLAAGYLQSYFNQGRRLPLALLLLHAMASALMVATVAFLPHFMLDRDVRLTVSTVSITLTAAGLAFLFVAGLSLWRGMRLLRFATLVPLALCVAYVLRVTAPVIDATQSARPVARSLQNVTTPVAVFHVSRSLEYGLGFYRNQSVPRYDRGEIPREEHFLIARQNQDKELSATLKQWQAGHSNSQANDCKEEVVHALFPSGAFPPQQVRFYKVHSASFTRCQAFQNWIP